MMPGEGFASLGKFINIIHVIVLNLMLQQQLKTGHQYQHLQ